jgi:hypothetical protein
MTGAVPDRVHPFALMFGSFRDERFPAVHTALGDNSDTNAFLLAAPALELLRELRPEDGLGEAVDDFVAFVHAAYLFWRDGEQTISLDEAATRRLCAPERHVGLPAPAMPTTTQYIQIAPRLIWGQLVEGEPFEPLDGWFAIHQSRSVRMVACFGVHEQRPGVSVAGVGGDRPTMAARPDGSPLFAPTMPGGDAAHLHAVSSAAELLLLGWRALVSEEVPQWP